MALPDLNPLAPHAYDRLFLPRLLKRLRDAIEARLAALEGGSGSLSGANVSMIAVVTTDDGDLACATPVAALPRGLVVVLVGDAAGLLAYVPGPGAGCYFSADGGATARAQGAVQVGDLLYWNGSVTTFQLDASFSITFLFTT